LYYISVLSVGLLFTLRQSAVSPHQVRLTKKEDDSEVKQIVCGTVLPAAKLISNEGNQDNYSSFSKVAALSLNNPHKLFLKIFQTLFI